MSTVIKVENLSKRYRLGVINRDMLYKDLQSRWAKFRGKEDPNDPVGSRHDKRLEHGDEFWALRNVDLEVKQGEILGVIGRNGAGKSTLLKILSRITAPTEGRIKVKGRIASLLEVGTGFHPELTGRENVFLNGAILGMTRNEVRTKLDEIVAFAELDEFIDTPVKRYSSGMYVRLAFAVAAHLEPEILIVDEVLAVGDHQFRKKCLYKMNEIGSSGRTIIFVSHDATQIKSLCTRVVLLEEGRIKSQGDPTDVVNEYAVSASAEDDPPTNPRERLPNEPQSASPRIWRAGIYDENGVAKTCFTNREMIYLEIDILPGTSNTKDYAIVWFMSGRGGHNVAVGASSPMDTVLLQPHTLKAKCAIDPESLVPGIYKLRFVLHVPHYDNFDEWANAVNFEVVENDSHAVGYNYPGIWEGSVSHYVKHKWSLQ